MQRETSAPDLNPASVFCLFVCLFYLQVAQTSHSQQRENTKKEMLTTLSSFVACSPGSSENREKVRGEKKGGTGEEKEFRRQTGIQRG